MRIRKNTKLSSILPSHTSTPETLRTHVCQLNQSPWDVVEVPLSQDSCLSLNYQFEGEDSFTGNGSFEDSMGAVESVASMMDGEDKTVMFKVDEVISDDNGIEMDIVIDYKNEPKNHHISDKGMAAASASASSRRGGRARAAAKKSASSSSNPYEFYYYSGFGPSWGKRRGERVTKGKKCEVKEADNNSSQNDKTPSSCSQINNDEYGFVDDEDDEDDENGDTIGKRIRKPVKARSLKSLM